MDYKRKYRVSKAAGWLFLVASLWLVIFNFTNLKIYLVLIYSGLWILLANNWVITNCYRKELLLCIQAGASSLLGYRVMARWLFVFNEKSIGGGNDTGSPLAFLIGSSIELIVFIILFVSLLEVVFKSEK